MNKDTIIGIVGAVILIAAMVGVFKYEGSQAAAGLGSNPYEVTWATESMNGPSIDGATDLDAESSETVTITQANLTRSQFTLSWETPQAGTKTVQLTVTPPEGSGLETQTLEESDGEIVLAFDVPNSVPDGAQFYANSDADAHTRLADQYTKTKGTGDWTVVVAFTDSQGVSPVPGVPDPTREASVAWELNTILDAFTPTLESGE